MSDIYIARGERLAARRLEAETIILCPDDSDLYVLNEVGTALWEAADGRTPLRAIVEGVICRDFEVESATALQDALEFVEGLRRQRILQVSDGPFEADGNAEGPPSTGLER
jgi:Coenzyme PQQ synthesis protein D (PqqD)